jgi:hypothetical protein
MKIDRDSRWLVLLGCTLPLVGNGCGSKTKASSRDAALLADVGAATGGVSSGGVSSTGGRASGGAGGTSTGGTVSGNGGSARTGGATGSGGMGTGGSTGHGGTMSTGGVPDHGGAVDGGNLDAATPTDNCSSSPLGGIGIPAGTVATANASSTPSSTPDLAIDGDMTTTWSSGASSGWLKLQFPKPTAITAVQIVAGSKPTDKVTYTITSDSQATIGSGTREVISGLAYGSMLDPISVSPGTYSSITITVNGSVSWVQIVELSLMNDECPRAGVTVDGGSASGCTGTPSPATCSDLGYTGCTGLVGCRSATGAFHCQGSTKQPCSTYSTSATCTATNECDWQDAGGSCSGSGTPKPCSATTTQSLCASRTGCTWSSATLACTGTPGQCSVNVASEACVAAGCRWTSGSCGTINCGDFTTSDLCSAAGCTWSHCTGSRQECSSVYDEDRCRSLGCNWWGVDSRCEGTPTPCAQLSASDCTHQPGCSVFAP